MIIQTEMHAHDPVSPFLLGRFQPGDIIHEARQESWKCSQLSLEL